MVNSRNFAFLPIQVLGDIYSQNSSFASGGRTCGASLATRLYLTIPQGTNYAAASLPPFYAHTIEFTWVPNEERALHTGTSDGNQYAFVWFEQISYASLASVIKKIPHSHQ